MGARLGYVRVPFGHPWTRDRYEGVEEILDRFAPGGITFAEVSSRGNLWVGFDTAHLGDLPDVTLPGGEDMAEIGRAWALRGVVRNHDYVVAACQHLCCLVASSDPKTPTEMLESLHASGVGDPNLQNYVNDLLLLNPSLPRAIGTRIIRNTIPDEGPTNPPQP